MRHRLRRSNKMISRPVASFRSAHGIRLEFGELLPLPLGEVPPQGGGEGNQETLSVTAFAVPALPKGEPSLHRTKASPV